MSTGTRLKIVEAERMRFSRAPSSELSAAAVVAQADAGLPPGGADFVVIALPRGSALDAAPGLLAEADAAAARYAARSPS